MFQSSPAPRRGRYSATRRTWEPRKLFQSSPAPRRGRYEIHVNQNLRDNRFNPRPRRGAGATQPHLRLLHRVNVSILARAEARALRQRCRATGQCQEVSILARAEARALLPCADMRRNGRRFQSSPAPRRGRYPQQSHQIISPILFQSSPAPRRGRYLVRAEGLAAGVDVSILARAEARALRSESEIQCAGAWFQSSPAPRRGRYQRRDSHCAQRPLVSILARAEARALRCAGA